jgi:hypothetical protein
LYREIFVIIAGFFTHSCAYINDRNRYDRSANRAQRAHARRRSLCLSIDERQRVRLS